MSEAKASHFALVLPGAVARGAYEAGVIEVLAENDIKIDRIVATSSGALNGLAYAAGIRAGREKEMAKRLTASWVKDGSWQNSLNINLWGLIRGRGLSTRAGVLKMMREMVKPCDSEIKYPVEFRVIVTPLDGIIGKIGEKEATTFETILKFADEDFDTPESLEKIFDAVTAACAFPGLFEPVEIEGLGPCVDGGAVNNAPIRYALEASDVNRVMMPIPFPAVMPLGAWKNGLGQLSHLIEILINERLFRDLKIAQSVNREAASLEVLLNSGIINENQFVAITTALEIRKVEVTEIRPEAVFKSSPFAGFFHQNDRKELIEAGRQAAMTALAIIPAKNPTGEQTT